MQEASDWSEVSLCVDRLIIVKIHVKSFSMWKMFTRDWKIFIEPKWMKFQKMHNNPPALFKYLSHGEGRGGEGTACSNTITSQLWLTLNLGHPTITPHHPRRGDTDWHPQVGGERGGIPEEQVQGRPAKISPLDKSFTDSSFLLT